MATYNGWTIVVMPTTPPAPQSIEIVNVNIVAANISPFSDQGQYYDWGPGANQCRVNLPPMKYATFQPWINFFTSLNGIANVFQFTSAFQAAYPLDIGSGVYWRMKSNAISWTINANHLYTCSFEIREAI